MPCPSKINGNGGRDLKWRIPINGLRVRRIVLDLRAGFARRGFA